VQKGRVLVIDDDPELRAMLEETLTLANYQVVLAADGKKGMEKLRATPADLVITDIFMPNEEGLETITKIRKDFPTVAIIAISGSSALARPMLTVALRLGADEVLAKPFQSFELLESVERVLSASPRDRLRTFTGRS